MEKIFENEWLGCSIGITNSVSYGICDFKVSFENFKNNCVIKSLYLFIKLTTIKGTFNYGSYMKIATISSKDCVQIKMLLPMG